ncbi:polyprenol phosphomannose-dependent alpha 1,6 mannosyltransferase MptB [Actinomadura meridiana]|uniref:polyprenol phosphomannose-dependent alpha 1,6 mannosyltransferase MptB n=1 Tax=Actinomadura meridiana TaxID=559626 RepID=UPI0031EAACAC
MSILSAANPAPDVPPASVRPRAGRVLGALGLALMVLSVALFAGGMSAGRSRLVPFLGNGGPFLDWNGELSWETVAIVSRTAAICAGLGVAGVLCALRRGWTGVSPRQLVLVGVGVAAVLTVLPPAGSSDILNYAVYGRISDLGFDPYSMTPEQLHHSGDPVGLLRPGSWADQPTVYGPVATAVQTVAARLGGSSMGWIVFWLKVFNAVAFLATAFLLDRLVGSRREARVRVAVLWTANPLALFWMVGSGHADVLAALLLVGAVYVLWSGLRQSWPSVLVGLGAGVLASGAISVKVTYALPVIGLGLACIRRPVVLISGAGGAVVAAGGAYLSMGRTALSSLSDRMAHDNDLFLPIPSAVVTRPLLYSVTMAAATATAAVLIWWRLRDRASSVSRDVLDIRPVVACAIACVVLSPVQYPWYDAAFLPMLALLAASRFDEALIARGAVLSFVLLPGIGTSQWQLDTVGLAAPFFIAVLVALCLLPRWRSGLNASVVRGTGLSHGSKVEWWPHRDRG